MIGKNSRIVREMLSITEIAKNINKDISTVAKEIQNFKIHLIILLLILNLKNVESVFINSLNMKKLNTKEDIEKLDI